MAVSQALKLSQIRQDIAARKTYIRVLWTSTQTGESHNDNQHTAYYWVSVNGVETRYSVTYTLPQNTQKTILDKTIEVLHDAKGQCTVRVRTEMDTRISAGVVKKNASITATPIDVGAIVSAGEQNIGSSLRISISNKEIDHVCELRYAFGSLSGIITENANAGYYDWTLPDSFYNEMPTVVRKTGTITCITYVNGSKLGQSSASFTAVVGDAGAPQISAAVAEDINEKTLALTGDSSVLVKGYSDARIVYILSGSPGATIVKTDILCGDGQRATNNIINSVKSGQFQITITDSRGMTAKRSFSQLLIDYMPVTCNLAAKGIDEVSGDIPAVISGACFSGSFGVVQNSFQLEYWIKEEGGEWRQGLVIGINYSENNKYSKEYGLPGYDYNKTYLLKFKVSDYLTEAWSSEVKVKTIPVFDWGENDFNFNVPVKMPELQLTESGIAALKKLLGIN